MTRAPGDSWIAVGVVARPHGVRGELRVHLHNAGSQVLAQAREVELEGKGRYRVQACRPERDALLLRLAGCDSRDAAEALRGRSILVPRSALPEPDDDEYYFCDLIGLAVVDPAGAPRGTIRDVVEGPGHATLVVARPGAPDVEVPLADAWVVSVEISGGRIVIRDLDALG